MTSKRQQYIQLGECPTNRPFVPYDPTHRVSNDIMNEFMNWVTNKEMGPQKSSTSILFRRECTTKKLFEELTRDSEWVENNVSYLTFYFVYNI